MRISLAKIIFLSLTIFLSSCHVTVTTDNGDTKSMDLNTDSKIRNGIELQAKGLEAEQAFLTFEDGSLVPEGNKTTTNQAVKLHLIISGWKEENEMVFPGASEKIETNDGGLVLDEPDLFSTYDATGIKRDDAKSIYLSATITKMEKLYDYFLVSFRVWDKKGDGEITGSYKLHL